MDRLQDLANVGPAPEHALDTFMSAVDQADGKPARPWWEYTPERKRSLAA